MKLAALQLQVVYGDHDSTLHKPSLIPEKRRMGFIHPKFRKDTRFMEQMFLEHVRYKNLDKTSAKRRYINIVRVLKRASENVFICHLYSTDKSDLVTIRKILLIISERVIGMDANNQVVVNDIPIDSIRALNNHHTSASEHEVFKSARRKLNNAEKLHLLVIDLGVTSVSLLTESRTAIRNTFETCLNGFWRAQKQVIAEKMEKMAPPETAVSLKELNTKKIFKIHQVFVSNTGDGRIERGEVTVYRRRYYIFGRDDRRIIMEIKI